MSLFHVDLPLINIVLCYYLFHLYSCHLTKLLWVPSNILKNKINYNNTTYATAENKSHFIITKLTEKPVPMDSQIPRY